MIPDAIRAQVVEAVRNGRYSLLLGAGYSASSTSADGTPLPIGEKLRDELADRFNLEKYYPLATLCSAIPQDNLNGYFQSRLKGCRASPGAQRLTRFVWSYIYTFNVDDVLESAYSLPGALQRPRHFTFKHHFHKGEDRAEVPTIHLHGSVLSPSHGYVFSPVDYGQSSASESTWFTIASDQLAEQPFIIIGSNHFQETDLEYYLARRKGLAANAPRVAPSLFVSNTIDQVKRANCEQRGLIPIQATSDEFFAELERLVGRAPTPLELALPSDPESLFATRPQEATIRVFFRQWLYVRPTELPQELPDTPDAHLLTGTEPRWSQLARDEDVLRTTAKQLLDDVARWKTNAPTETTFQLIASTPGDGKTTTLMRVALELAKSGETAFWYNTRERLLVDSAADALAHCKKPPVLVIDRASEHGHQIADLIAVLQRTKTAAFLISADRLSYSGRIQNALPGAFMEHRLRHLSLAEASEMIDRMRPLGLLGRRAGQPTRTLAGSIVNQSWFVGTVLLNKHLPSIAAVISQELATCDPVSKRVYSVVSLAHMCGFPVRLAIIQRAARASLNEVMDRLNGQLKGLIRGLPPHGDFRETRHSLVAEAVVRSLTPAERFEAIKALASALAPYVNRQTLIAGTDEARLAARLLDSDNLLQDLLGTAATESFYLAIRDDWEWNSRFWEQLALLKLPRDPTTALRYAETAVGIEKHPVPLTTLAKVRFRLAKANGPSSAGFLNLREGIDCAKEAVSIGRSWRRRDIHPFDVGLRGIVEFIKGIPARDRHTVPADIIGAGAEFAAEGTPLFKLQQQTDLLEEWRSLNLGRPAPGELDHAPEVRRSRPTRRRRPPR